MPVLDTTDADALGKLEQVGTRDLPGVIARVVIDRQLAGLVGNERVVLLAQPATNGQVPGMPLETNVRRHARIVGTVVLGNKRADGRIHPPVAIAARGGLAVTCLESHVWFVITLVSIHGPHDSELVEHRRLFGQTVTDDDARLGGLDHAKWTTIVVRSVGLGIPRVDMAGTTGHPQQDHRLAVGHRST